MNVIVGATLRPTTGLSYALGHWVPAGVAEPAHVTGFGLGQADRLHGATG